MKSAKFNYDIERKISSAHRWELSAVGEHQNNKGTLEIIIKNMLDILEIALMIGI